MIHLKQLRGQDFTTVPYFQLPLKKKVRLCCQRQLWRWNSEKLGAIYSTLAVDDDMQSQWGACHEEVLFTWEP